MAVLKATSSLVIGTLERFFYRWGCYVSRHPFVVITACIFVTGLCCLGFLGLRSEGRAEKLWIPGDSSYISNKAWLDENFPREHRPQLVIFESQTDNILTRDNLLKMLSVRNEVVSLSAGEGRGGNNVTWENLCFRIPIANIFLTKKRRKRRRRRKRDMFVRENVEYYDDGDDKFGSLKVGATITVGVVANNNDGDKEQEEELRDAFAVGGRRGDLGKIPQIAREKSPTSLRRKEKALLDRDDANSSTEVRQPVRKDEIAVAANEIGAVASDEGDEAVGVVDNAKDTETETNKDDKIKNVAEEDNPWGEYDEEEEDDYYYDVEDYDLQDDDLFKDSDEGDEQDEVLEELPRELYCDLVSTLNEKCLELSILEIWRFSEKRIAQLSQQQIIDDINLFNESPVYGHKVDFTSFLGGVARNASGHVTSARSALHTWVSRVDLDGELVEEGGAGVELELADTDTLNWEKTVIQKLLDQQQQGDVRVYVNLGRSFNDVSSAAIFFDGAKMVAGYLLMFAYTAVFLTVGGGGGDGVSSLNSLEHRALLTLSGIAAVAMGLAVAFGLTGALGMTYTPMHAILPFLCLGIGIDDMFVIVQCWSNLPPASSPSDLSHRLGSAMRHAGVAVTVTSLTDVFAFGIGAVTILPGLQAFCVSCALGIGFIFLLQTSWFVAWFALDQRRIQSRRDGCLPCLRKGPNWRPWLQRREEDDGKKGESKMTSSAAQTLRRGSVKVLVLVTTAALLSVGTWGCLLIRQEFDPVLFLPPGSYLRDFVELHERQFPNDGWDAQVYTGALSNPRQDLRELDRVTSQMEQWVEQGRVLKDVDCWWPQFKVFLERDRNISEWRDIFDSSAKNGSTSGNSSFPLLLSDFLFSKSGSKFTKDFRFGEEELVCNSPAPEIKAISFSLRYLKFSGPEEHIPGRRMLTHLIDSANFSSRAFSFSKVYAAWETDEVIGHELWRNLGLAAACVFCITLVLLSDLRICLLVLLCVVATLADVVGVLHFWGATTVDTVSAVNIVLAVGLCVDYSAHIAHAYIVAEGSSEDKAVTALSTMGPAILNGGLTTFLALIFLGFSQSHVFIVFFKVFLLTVVFGLFHGLLFLPVVLSMLSSGGKETKAKPPPSSASAESIISKEESVEGKTEAGPDNDGTDSSEGQPQQNQKKLSAPQWALPASFDSPFEDAFVGKKRGISLLPSLSAARALTNRLRGSTSSSWQPGLIPERAGRAVATITSTNSTYTGTLDHSSRYFMRTGILESPLEEEMREVAELSEEDRATAVNKFERNQNVGHQTGGRLRKKSSTTAMVEGNAGPERRSSSTSTCSRRASSVARPPSSRRASRPPSSASTVSSTNPNWILLAVNGSSIDSGEDDEEEIEDDVMPWKNKRALQDYLQRPRSRAASAASGSARFVADGQFSIYRPSAAQLRDLGGGF